MVTLEEWESWWTAETLVAWWTRRILPSVHRWVARPAGSPVTFHLAQVLTDHGAFNEYLCRFWIIEFASYAHCEAPVDNVAHTIFHCPFWEGYRFDLVEQLGHPARLEDIEELLCGRNLSDHQIHPARSAFLAMVEELMAAMEDA